MRGGKTALGVVNLWAEASDGRRKPFSLARWAAAAVVLSGSLCPPVPAHARDCCLVPFHFSGRRSGELGRMKRGRVDRAARDDRAALETVPVTFR